MPPCFFLTMKNSTICLLLILIVSLVACDKGKLKENLPPETRISVTEINLVGEDRLRSEVSLFWVGSDADGWVVGYEMSMDGSNWSEVSVQDSTFNFSLDPGSDTTDIDFYVRAIDNDGARDNTPAYLKVPIKNSAPTAIFDSLRILPDTGYVVLTMFLEVDDEDGTNNLDSIFLKLNNGDWYPLAPGVNTLTLVPTDPAATGTIDCQVYEGPQASLLSDQIQGMNLEGDNTFYLKARDIAGAESPVDTSRVVFMNRKSGNLLLVDAHTSGVNPTPEEVYDIALTSQSIAYDRIDFTIANGANVPELWIPTFSFYMELYDAVFWYGSTGVEEVALLESAAGSIQDYLTGGGKMLISTSFPNSFDNTSVIQEFSPMDSLSTSSGSCRLPTDSLVMPMGAFGNYDTLEVGVFIGRATPFYVKSTAEPMFTGQVFTGGGWVGPTTVAARNLNGSGKTNMVFVSIELQQLNGRPQALENFFNQVFLNEFNW